MVATLWRAFSARPFFPSYLGLRPRGFYDESRLCHCFLLVILLGFSTRKKI